MQERPAADIHEADARVVEQLPRIRKREHGPYHTRKCGEAPPPELLVGIDELNRGLYFEQHETLELLWRREPDDVRYLYQGILLIGVGCYHLLRGNTVGARIKLNRGLELLRWFEPSCQGVAVSRLVVDAERCLASVLALSPGQEQTFDRGLLPRVHLLDQSQPNSLP